MVEVSKDGLLPVTQADRDAALDTIPDDGSHSSFMIEQALSGEGADDWPLVQTFARHRIEATATLQAERDRYRVIAICAALCLSGFAGEGLCVDGFDDPADMFGEIVDAVGMPDADDDDLRTALSETPTVQS